MIRLFDVNYHDNYLAKVNYVDDQNYFAGFDMEQRCCESADHWIEDSKGNKVEPNTYNGCWYYLQFTGELPTEDELCDYDTYRVRIPLKHDCDNEPYYLVFENCHNGYYAHGYEFGRMEIEKDGSL